MKSFSYIIYYFLTGNRYLTENDMKLQLIKGDIVIFGFFCSLQDKNNKGERKLDWFVNTIMNAIFIQPEKKERIQIAFYKAQKVYYGMCRLARHFKMKRARLYDVEHDLCFNPLSELRENMKYHLYDDNNRTLYAFRISDLITLINNALMHSPDFFAEPKPIRNPYTNIELTTAQLYSLYFAVKESPYVIPLLFHQYFKYEFNLFNFCKANECYIREIAIQSFVKNATTQQKYRTILKMFVDYKKQLEGIVIHNDFPKETLVSHFSKYLHDYLLECYSLNPAIRHISKRKLKGELVSFRTLNPSYGRKIRTYQLKPSNLSKDQDNNTFVFGNPKGRKLTKLNFVYSFVDTVVTKPRSFRRVRAEKSRRETQRRERRAALIRNRRRTEESRSNMNELLDSAFSLLRRTDENTTTEPISNVIISSEGSNSDDTMDIDLVIDAMNSDESSIESDDDNTMYHVNNERISDDDTDSDDNTDSDDEII